MGVSLGLMGKFTEAVNCFNQALKIDDENDDAWNNKGTALFNLSKYSEALECFNKALELNPENSKAWAGKGSVKRFLGDYKGAVKCLEKFIELNQMNPTPQVEEAWAMIFDLKMIIINQDSQDLN
ncbi:MAG: tetratricopeptide repeat protein [Methanobacterium sp.]